MTENKIATASESNENSSFNLWTLWRDIIEAVKGSEQDFTSGSIGRAILLLSIPMVLEMMMESVFAIVDIFFVSKLGADAVATVGLTESMLTIVYAISIGLSLATTAIVSRRIGEKNHEGAAVATVQAILTGILVSVFIAVPGIFFAPDLLRLMGATQEIIDSGFVFTSIMIGSNVIIMLLFIINAVFRGAGDAAYAMRILWIANLINIVLDPCLILGLGPFPELGVTGAAVATAIGRGTAVIFQFILLLKRSGRIKIHREQIRFDFSVMKRLLRLSLGGIGQFLIATSSWIGLMRIMAVFGSESLAGDTTTPTILNFFCFWLIEVPLAYMLALQFGLAETGVFLAIISSESLLGILGIIVFRRGRWKLRKV